MTAVLYLMRPSPPGLFVEPAGDFGQGPETGMAVLAPEHALKLDQLAPEVLRRVAATFVEETSATKLQLITSVTKQRLTQPGNAQLAALHRYVISVARYDQDYDASDKFPFANTNTTSLA